MRWAREIWAQSGLQLRRLAGFLAAALFIGFGVEWMATSNARMIMAQPSAINDLAFSPDGTVLAIAYANGVVELRETDHDRRLIRRIKKATAPVMDLHLDDVTDAGLRLIMARSDGLMVIERALEGDPLSDELTFSASVLTPQFKTAEDGAIWAHGINEDGPWIARLASGGDLAQPIGLGENGSPNMTLLSATSERAYLLTEDQLLIWGTWDPESDTGIEFPITIKDRLPRAEHYVTLQDGRVMAAVNGAWRSVSGTFIEDERGVAGMYGGGMQGSSTASGDPFSPTVLTAAHQTLPFDSMIEVTNEANGRSITLRVNDRGPFDEDRILDVTSAAATALGLAEQGFGNVRIKYLGQRSSTAGDIALENVQLETEASEIVLNAGEQTISARFSNDGSLLAVSGTEPGLWETDTMTELAPLPIEGSGSWDIQFSSDDRRLITIGEDEVARVWDTDTQTEIATLNGNERPLSVAIFSNDDQLIAAAGESGIIRIWDSETYDLRTTLSTDDLPVHDLDFSEDNQRLVSGHESGQILVWDLTTELPETTLQANSWPVFSTKFSHRNSQILSAGADGTTRAWDVATGEVLFQIEANSAWQASYTTDENRILIAHNDYASVWDSETREEIARLSRQQNVLLEGAIFSPDDTKIVTVDRNGAVVWTEVQPDIWRPARWNAACRSNDGNGHLDVWDNNPEALWIWSREDGLCKQPFSSGLLSWSNPLPADTTTLAFLSHRFSNSGQSSPVRSVLVGRANGSVEHREEGNWFSNDKVHAVYEGHGGPITHIETAEFVGGKRAAIGAADGSVQIIELPDHGSGSHMFAETNTDVTAMATGLNRLRLNMLDALLPAPEPALEPLLDDPATTPIATSDEPDPIELPVGLDVDFESRRPEGVTADGRTFSFYPPGDLIDGSGQGAIDQSVFAPDIVFPIKTAPAFINSQVWNAGGAMAGGDQCDPSNYDYPWRDSFCETRPGTTSNPFCSNQKSTQHVSIRAGNAETCNEMRAQDPQDRMMFEVVAVEDGIVRNVGTYSVRLSGMESGNIYTYQHLNMRQILVSPGDTVAAGQVIGYLSNDFGATPTNFQLSFSIRSRIGDEHVYVPPYSSLVLAYERRENVVGTMISSTLKADSE